MGGGIGAGQFDKASGLDRAVDMIEERIDLALRVRVAPTSDAALTMRTLGTSARILVASLQMASHIGGGLSSLVQVPTLGTNDDIGEIECILECNDGATHRLRQTPRMTCGDLTAMRTAAIQGLGMALLPDHICADALKNGQLVHVLPQWRAQIAHRPPGIHDKARPSSGRARLDRSSGDGVSKVKRPPQFRTFQVAD